MAVVVNLGGEGEEPGALNVNAFIKPTMLNRRFDVRVSEALIVRRSAHDTGLSDESVDEVIANHFPIQFNEFIVDETGRREPIELLVEEIYRILQSSGVVRFGCSSCDRDALAHAFMLGGMTDVVVTGDGYVRCTKP